MLQCICFEASDQAARPAAGSQAGGTRRLWCLDEGPVEPAGRFMPFISYHWAIYSAKEFWGRSLPALEELSSGQVAWPRIFRKGLWSPGLVPLGPDHDLEVAALAGLRHAQAKLVAVVWSLLTASVEGDWAATSMFT